MLLQDDAHQLTARADASLREELLKCGFDRALGDSDSVRNLLIGKTLEYTGEHPLFSFSEPPTSIFLCSSLVSEGGLQLLLIQPYLAGHHITDSLRQQCGRVTFQENPGNPGADQFRCHPSIQTCCHNQNLSREPLRPGQFHRTPGHRSRRDRSRGVSHQSISPAKLAAPLESSRNAQQRRIPAPRRAADLHFPGTGRGRLTTKCESPFLQVQAFTAAPSAAAGKGNTTAKQQPSALGS